MYTNLISTAQLSRNLRSPGWVIVDCRFDLTRPESGFEDYLKSHIPGAVYANLDKDMSGTRTALSGRHPLPEAEQFARRLSAWGIDPSRQVILYDASGGSYAARLWWMLRLFDYNTVAVLDGGWLKWVKEGLPVIAGEEAASAAALHTPAAIHWEMVAAIEDVETIRQSSEHRLIDARSPERYRGEIEPIDTIAGHIPGAVNRFHGDNLGSDGTFKSPAALRNEYEILLAGAPPQNVIVYCGSGVTSCHHLLAMDYAGLPGARLYVGSWSEWIRDPLRPIAAAK